MSKGDNSDKYRLKKQLDGELTLDKSLHEAIAHAYAKGESEEEFRIVLNATEDDMKAVLVDPFFSRRVKHLKKEYDRDAKTAALDDTLPKTPDEYSKYALRRLH